MAWKEPLYKQKEQAANLKIRNKFKVFIPLDLFWFWRVYAALEYNGFRTSLYEISD